MLIFVRIEMGDSFVIDVDPSSRSSSMKFETGTVFHWVSSGCLRWQHIEDGRRVLDYNTEEESAVFAMLLMHTSLERRLRPGGVSPTNTGWAVCRFSFDLLCVGLSDSAECGSPAGSVRSRS